MRPNEFSLAKQVVKEQYKELMNDSVPFLQIFPEMIQEAEITWRNNLIKVRAT